VEVDRALVTRIAHLAQIEIPESDIAFYQHKMRELLTFVDEVNAVSAMTDVTVSDAASLGHPRAERDDEVKLSQPFELVACNAPAVSGTAFEVPRIVDR